jgi:uncharacterized damage-inducible protein DinB
MKPSQLFSHWVQVRDDLMTTVDKFSQTELDFTPFEGSRSAGEIMLHIAEAEDGWFRYVIAGELEAWPDQYRMHDYPTLSDIQFALRLVHCGDAASPFHRARRSALTPCGLPGIEFCP